MSVRPGIWISLAVVASVVVLVLTILSAHAHAQQIETRTDGTRIILETGPGTSVVIIKGRR